MTNEEFLSLIFNRLNLVTSGWHDDHNAYAHAKKLVAVVEVSKKLYKSGRFDNWDNAVADLAMALDELERE